MNPKIKTLSKLENEIQFIIWMFIIVIETIR